MLPTSPSVRAVAIVSGGLDSTTMLTQFVKDPDQQIDIVQAISFNYGQRHKKELEYAERSADALSIPWTLIDLWSSGLTEALSDSGSSLVDSKVEVPDGHYAQESMKATVVPNRNMIMLSIAGGIAVAKNAPLVLTGVHAGDHFIYPDCRPGFIGTASNAFKLGNLGFGPFEGMEEKDIFKIVGGFYAPYTYFTKADIARTAIENGVKFEETWSCYKGDSIHCGRCGTCVERLEAIDEAARSMGFSSGQEIDLTEYADSTFWKEAIRNAG